MHKLARIAIVGLLPLGGRAVALAQTNPAAAPPIVVDSIESAGSGCPHGTAVPVRVTQDASGQVLTISLSDYRAFVDASTAFMTRECRLTVVLKAQPGYRTALVSVLYYGQADLEPGTSAVLNAVYNWSGRPVGAVSLKKKLLEGPFVGPFTFTDQVSREEWSACATEETLNMTTDLTVWNTDPPSTIGEAIVDRTDVDLKSSVLLIFRRRPC